MVLEVGICRTAPIAGDGGSAHTDEMADVYSAQMLITPQSSSSILSSVRWAQYRIPSARRRPVSR